MSETKARGAKIRGPGRPWGEKLKAKEKRTVLVGLRISPEDAKRLDAVLKALAGEDNTMTASSYAYAALLRAIERDERKLARARK